MAERQKIILYVEDYPTGMDQILEEYGVYFVVSYNRGTKAIEEIKNGLCYDLLLSDLSLPDMGGDEVMHASKQVNPQIPTICYSGYTIKPSSADYFIKKGDHPMDFVKMIDDILKTTAKKSIR